MSTLEKLVAEDAAIYRAEWALRARKNELEAKLQGYQGKLAIVDNTVYQVKGLNKPYIVKVGHMP